jgi:tetratricopeptide (TPR) repeat protein
VRAEIGLVLALLATALPAAAQLDSETALREGSASFRSGLYHTALVRYREAAAAGMESPLLHYNLGVTYYRLERYVEAQESLERATQDPTLGPLAAYNLGLAYRATGDSANAQRWFDAAAAAVPALAREVTASPQQPQPAAARISQDTRTLLRGDTRIGEFNLMVNAGYGQDDNANRSPAAPYVDLSAPGQPLVTPEPVVATYTAIDAAAEYRLHNEAGDSDFLVGYQLDGDYYDHEFANSEVTQRLFFGADLVLGEHARRSRSLKPGMFLVQHYQRNFDPDNGIDRDVDGVDVALLYTYKAAGLDADFAHTLGAWQWGFDLQLERREHERSPPVPNFDNELYLAELFVRYAWGDATTLSVELPRYRRVFDEYRARDLAGDMLSANSPLDYEYSGVRIGVDRKLGQRIDVAFAYSQLTRVDGFVGYADYTQDVATLRVSFRPTDRWFLALGATSRVYDYANAFAYNDSAAGPKELDELTGELWAEFRVSEHWSVSADLATQDVTSTDERAAYARARSVISATWRR